MILKFQRESGFLKGGVEPHLCTTLNAESVNVHFALLNGDLGCLVRKRNR